MKVMIRKKSILFFFSLFCAIVAHAESLSAWTGSFDPQGWNAEQEVVLDKVEVGNKVVFKGETYDNAQIQISSLDWNVMFTDDYTSFGGSYTIKANSDNVDVLRKGVRVKGQNFKLTSVEIVSAPATETYALLPWEGSFDPQHWEEALTLKASELEEGLQIVFHGEAYGGAQIQLGDGALENFYDFGGNNYTDFEDGFAVDVTADNKAFFENGFKVKGQNFTLTSVTVVKNEGGSTGGDGSEGGDSTGGETGGSGSGGSTITPVANGYRVVVWEGAFPIEWTGNGLKLLGYRFADAKAGDKLIFTITDAKFEGKKGPQLQIGNSNYSAIVEGTPGQGCIDIKKGESTYTLILDADQAEELIEGGQDGGLRIKGQNCTLTSVVLETATPQYEYTKIAIFTPKNGALDMGMWSDDALTKIDKLEFVNANLQEGDRVVFNLTETKETESAQLQIATLMPLWDSLRSEFVNTGVQTPRFWFTVTAEEAEALRTKSMGIKGTKCILKSVEVWHRNGLITTKINDPVAETLQPVFNPNMPYEVYNIQGLRLNGFESGRHQLYIVLQNGKSFKIMQ